MKIKTELSTLDLSVVIPTLHEVTNLVKLLPILKDSLDNLSAEWEIIVVDGNSRDGTQDVCESEGVRFICEEAPGYGAAILHGFSEALGEYVLTMDADLSHPASVIDDLWKSREDAEIVIASRYVPGGRADQPWVRLQLSCILNQFFRTGLSIEGRDMSSGFRLYRKEPFALLDLEFMNFVILIEIVLKAHAKGMTVLEIPFHYQPRDSGSSKARVYQFGKDYLRLFYRIWKLRNSGRHS